MDYAVGEVSEWYGKVDGEEMMFANEYAGLIASGSQDTLIDVREPFSGKIDADYLLLGHTHNVCSLDYYDGVLVSGSWDG
jgi:hypothetical protein